MREEQWRAPSEAITRQIKEIRKAKQVRFLLAAIPGQCPSNSSTRMLEVGAHHCANRRGDEAA